MTRQSDGGSLKRVVVDPDVGSFILDARGPGASPIVDVIKEDVEPKNPERLLE
jgi:hypothetical protein